MSLEPGWYIPTKQTKRPRPRWVLASSATHVLYSTGSRKRECLLSTFTRWQSRTEAKRRTDH